MLEFAARRAGRLAVGLLGAVVIAAAISAIAEPRAPGFGPFLEAGASRFVHFLKLDFGTSAITGLPAAHELALRLPDTLLLVLGGSLIALLVGVPLGLLFAIGPARRTVAPLMQIVTAAPVFLAGLALAFGAGHLLGWPMTVNSPVSPATPEEALQISALPVLTVGLAGAAAVQLALRRAASLSAGAPFRTGLKRLGLGGFEVERLYIVPQVLAALVASAGEIMLALLSAAVVAEWVFLRQGAADLFVKAIALHDWNMTGLILLVFAGLAFVTDFLGRIAGFVLANEGKR